MMGYSAKVILDSISPRGDRLTTMECCYPRFVHSELMTHRVFSRNAASSRAIPVKKTIAAVEDNPAYPVFWGKSQSGMQAREELTGEALENAKRIWFWATRNALDAARWAAMEDTGLHKQLTNRLIEPFSWITVIVSATEWDNFFKLRCREDAQPELRRVAELMRAAREASTPKLLGVGDWHLPYIADSEEFGPAVICAHLQYISAARCARVSYLTHDGKRDLSADLDMAGRLIKSGHWSPFEHVATPVMLADDEHRSNYRGWNQLRHILGG